MGHEATYFTCAVCVWRLSQHQSMGKIVTFAGATFWVMVRLPKVKKAEGTESV
jgi:hypothetical protein